MTSEDRRPDPEHDDELADSIDIDDHAVPRHAAQPGSAPAQPAVASEGAELSSAAPSPAPDASDPAADPSAAAPAEPMTFWQRRKAARAEKAARPKRKAPWWELPALVVLAILIAILVKTFVVQPFYIPSESMETTLHGCTGCAGDRILVNKPIFDFRDPEPGDIVVFDAPKDWNEEQPVSTQAPSNPVLRGIRSFGQLIGFVPPDDLVLVKRVIAVGGQTVRGKELPGGGDQVQISDNGPDGPWRTLDETYVHLDGPDDRADFGPVTVPKGRLWVMGDHRNASADSRYHCTDVGTTDSDAGATCNPVTSTVPVDDVIGKAFVIAWPPSRWRTLGTPATFESAAAGGVLPLGVVLPVFLLRRRRRRRG